MTVAGLARSGFLDIIFPPGHCGERRIGMFAAYADRSTVGSGGTQVFTVAAIVAPTAKWRDYFAPAWASILRREGIDCFHMTDYESGKVLPYKNWPKEKRIAFMAELIEVIAATETVAGAVALDLRAYEKLAPDQRRVLGRPYRFCGALLLRMLSLWFFNELVPEPIAYVFESGDLGSGELKNAVVTLPKGRRRELLVQSFVYGDKDEFIQLQAADVLAYEAAKAAIRDIGADRRAQRASLLAVLDGVPSRGYLFDEQTLNRWVVDKRDPFGYAG